VARIAPSGRQLDPAGPEADGVVASDLARVAAAEDEGEIARGETPGGRRVARGPREAGVQVSEEFGQKGIGPLGGGDVAQAQFAAQAILQGAPEAFDAAVGFGRAGREVADTEIVQDAAEVGGVLGAPELFGEAPVRVMADEDVDAIAVEGEGPPILGEHLLEDDGVAVQVLGRAEVQGEHGTGGIIDGAVQGHGGAAGLEPGVDLHSHAQTVGAHRLQAFDGVTTTLELEAGALPVAAEAAYARAGVEGRPLNYGYSASWAGARIEILTGHTGDRRATTMLTRFADPSADCWWPIPT